MASVVRRWTTGTKRGAAVMMCGALLAVLPAMAQQDENPPASPLTAQPQGPAQGRPGARMGEMLKGLNLAPEQEKTVRESMEEQRSKMKALREDSSLDQAERRKQMRQVREDTMGKIRAVLNDDQKAKFDAEMAQMRQQMRERRQGGGDEGVPPPAAVPPQS